jgi:hypothetical protein
MRQMCMSCPFNPKSVFYKFKNDWTESLKEATLPHGCHEIEDVGEIDNMEAACIGHLQILCEKNSCFTNSKTVVSYK